MSPGHPVRERSYDQRRSPGQNTLRTSDSPPGKQPVASAMPCSNSSARALGVQGRDWYGAACGIRPSRTVMAAYVAWVPAALSGGDTLTIAACPGGSQRWRPPRFVMAGKPCWWETKKGEGTWISPRPSPIPNIMSYTLFVNHTTIGSRDVPPHQSRVGYSTPREGFFHRCGVQAHDCG